MAKKTPKKKSRSERRERNIRAVKAGIKIEKPHKVAPLPPLGARDGEDGEAPAESERRPTSQRADKASTKERGKRAKPNFGVIIALIGAAAVVAYAGQGLFSKKGTAPPAPTGALTAGAVVHPFGAPPINAATTATERVIQPTPEPPAPVAPVATATATASPPVATTPVVKTPVAKPKPAAAPKPAATAKPASKPKPKPASDDPY